MPTRREALKALVMVLAAAPMLAAPPERRCRCDAPLWTFEEWQAERPRITVTGHGHVISPDLAEAVDRIGHQIDQDILKVYLRRFCPVHGDGAVVHGLDA